MTVPAKGKTAVYERCFAPTLRLDVKRDSRMLVRNLDGNEFVSDDINEALIGKTEFWHGGK